MVWPLEILPIFLGAIYLYVINCVFICISTFLIAKYLKYQPVANPNPKLERIIRYAVTSIILVIILPSAYLAYELFEEKKYMQSTEKFIREEFVDKGYTTIHKHIKYKEDPRIIELAFLTHKIDSVSIVGLNQKL